MTDPLAFPLLRDPISSRYPSGTFGCCPASAREPQTPGWRARGSGDSREQQPEQHGEIRNWFRGRPRLEQGQRLGCQGFCNWYLTGGRSAGHRSAKQTLTGCRGGGRDYFRAPGKGSRWLMPKVLDSPGPTSRVLGKNGRRLPGW